MDKETDKPGSTWLFSAIFIAIVCTISFIIGYIIIFLAQCITRKRNPIKPMNAFWVGAIPCWLFFIYWHPPNSDYYTYDYRIEDNKVIFTEPPTDQPKVEWSCFRMDEERRPTVVKDDYGQLITINEPRPLYLHGKVDGKNIIFYISDQENTIVTSKYGEENSGDWVRVTDKYRVPMIAQEYRSIDQRKQFFYISLFIMIVGTLCLFGSLIDD